EPKPAAAPAGTATAATAAAAQTAQIDSLVQSALAAGLPIQAIQQIISQASANPGLLAGVVGTGTPTTAQKPPSLTHPRVYITVNVQNLLNHTRINGYSGVITSPLFGKPTSFSQGRSVYFTINEQF